MITSFAAATLLIGILIAILGALFVLFPPRKIKWVYGYRTRSAMRNAETWKFANRYSAELMFLTGLSAIALGSLSFLIPLLNEKGGAIGAALIVIGLFSNIILTEKAIRKRFDNTAHPDL